MIKVADIARSTYYYNVKQFNMPDKYAEIKAQISEIYHGHKGRYGYRRIAIALQNSEVAINHKTVWQLMKTLGFKSMVRVKKYRSYKGDVGKVASNLLNRDFKANKQNEKWATDITEFSLSGQKIYLSPILDLYNGEIISYNITKH